MASELKNLRWAIDQFAPDFDADAWREAFDGGDPRLAANRSAVLFPFGNAFNCWNEIARRADWIREGTVRRDVSMPAVYDGLASSGALPTALAERLKALNRHARNALTHRYPWADALDVRNAIIDFLRGATAMIDALRGWLGDRGYRL